MDLRLDVVKIKVDSALFLALSVFVHSIVFFKDFDQVAGVLLAHIFDPEIIDY